MCAKIVPPFQLKKDVVDLDGIEVQVDNTVVQLKKESVEWAVKEDSVEVWLEQQMTVLVRSNMEKLDQILCVLPVGIVVILVISIYLVVGWYRRLFLSSMRKRQMRSLSMILFIRCRTSTTLNLVSVAGTRSRCMILVVGTISPNV